MSVAIELAPDHITNAGLLDEPITTQQTHYLDRGAGWARFGQGWGRNEITARLYATQFHSSFELQRGRQHINRRRDVLTSALVKY